MHPVDLTADRSDRHSRLTAFFRYFTLIPHAIVVAVWGIAAQFVVLIAWFAVVFTGRFPAGMQGFVQRWFIYASQVNGYASLLTDRFPAFGPSDDYPVRVVIEVPERQSRVKALFRLILAIWALIVAYILNAVGGIVLAVSWVMIVLTGSNPAGLHDFQVQVQRFGARLLAYVLLLVDAYPSWNAEGASSQSAAPATDEPTAAW